MLNPRVRVLWFVFLVLVAAAASDIIAAQSPKLAPTFDAASIKPNKGDTVSGGFDVAGGRWQMRNHSNRSSPD
jgi:hypothetical protein